MLKQPKTTKALFVKEVPAALLNAFAAKAKLRGKTIKQRILELMRADIK